MKKIETVWCQLLFNVLEKREIRFQQQELAKQLSISYYSCDVSLIFTTSAIIYINSNFCEKFRNFSNYSAQGDRLFKPFVDNYMNLMR